MPYPEPIVVTGESAHFPQPGLPPGEPGSEPADIVDLASIVEIGDLLVDHQWQRIEFKRSFSDPVIVVKPLSGNGSDPAVARIDGIDEQGFWVRIQEWDYLDDEHAIESVSYMVMERGLYRLPGGALVEADALQISGDDNFSAIAFNAPFVSIPVVLSGVSTSNDPSSVTTRMRAIDQSGFELALRAEEASDWAHGIETVAYIAWEPSLGEVNGLRYEVGQTFDEVTHKPHQIVFGSEFGAPPILLADMQTTDGGDTANLRWRNRGLFSIDVWVDEEQSKDREIKHTTERVGYIAIAVAGPPAPLIIEIGEVNVGADWKPISLNKSFSDPVVIAKIMSAYDTDPAVIRIDTIDSTGFSIRLQEWGYLDDDHGTETVSYMVVERGRHRLPNGSWIVADHIDTDVTNGFVPLTHALPFSTVPVVLTSVTSYSDSNAVTTRVRKVDQYGFQVGLEEEEASQQQHLSETISYVALEPTSLDLDGLTVEVGRTADNVTDRPQTVPFPVPWSDPPTIIADLQSTDGGDTANLRLHATDGISVDVWVQEEQSRDAETAHTTETLGYIIANDSADLLP
ncbi:MAG: hypothetical protein WBG92_06765 [Thiohalocapsa sp.]